MTLGHLELPVLSISGEILQFSRFQKVTFNQGQMKASEDQDVGA